MCVLSLLSSFFLRFRPEKTVVVAMLAEDNPINAKVCVCVCVSPLLPFLFFAVAVGEDCRGRNDGGGQSNQR